MSAGACRPSQSALRHVMSVPVLKGWHRSIHCDSGGQEVSCSCMLASGVMPGNTGIATSVQSSLLAAASTGDLEAVRPVQRAVATAAAAGGSASACSTACSPGLPRGTRPSSAPGLGWHRAAPSLSCP